MSNFIAEEGGKVLMLVNGSEDHLMDLGQVHLSGCASFNFIAYNIY
jgi:hypothetical protein